MIAHCCNVIVQLWTCGNYHWYLKQSLHFNAEQQTVAMIIWDTEQAYRLHIMFTQGQYLQYTWSWATATSNGCGFKDGQSIVAVIDGGKCLSLYQTTHCFNNPGKDMV